MHRTEGYNNDDYQFTDGPPATVVESAWLNSVQEEICNVIEEAGIVVRDKASDTQRNQLSEAIGIITEDVVNEVGYLLPVITPAIDRTIISNNAVDADHDLDFTAGKEWDHTGMHRMLGSAWTKCFDNPSGAGAWEAGDGGNGLFAGALANSTFYKVYKIRKDSDGSIDYGADTVANGVANLPAGWSVYRMIWIFQTDGTANIKPFFQDGNRCYWKTSANDYTLANHGTNAVLAVVNGPPGATCYVNMSRSNAAADALYYGLMTSPDCDDVAPSISLNTVGSTGGASGTSANTIPVKLDSSSRVRYRFSASGASHIVYLRVESFIIPGI